MNSSCMLNPLDFTAFAVIQLDEKYDIRGFNDKAQLYFKNLALNCKIMMLLPWFRREWLTGKTSDRVVKTSPSGKLLMSIVRSKEDPCFYLLFKSTDEYRNLMHLWCEVEDSLIRLQPFIDNSHDGILITNGEGTVRALNKAFCLVSGLDKEDLLGKSVYELVKNKQIPYCSMMRVLEYGNSESSFVTFPQGKETMVSSTPLKNRQGEIIRVLSNVRDITELETLHEKLRSAQAAAKHYQKELNAKISEETKSNFLDYHSSQMQTLYELVEKVADTDLPLLITGESGVGKTELAKHIHAFSERNGTGTFVHINCSAIPENLLESELFGYEAGAFTGANKSHIGLFEIAHRGTILLDEIGDMSIALQAKMLNVLQEKSFYRVGGSKPVQVDVRIIAATNKNMENLILQGLFRRDLYFRLNVIPIMIPPLRARKEDIGSLVVHYLAIMNRRHKKHKTLSRDAIDVLLAYDWPGNIREIMNVMERLVVLINDDSIEPRHLPLEMVANLCDSLCGDSYDMGTGAKATGHTFWQPGVLLKEAVTSVETDIIEAAIVQYPSIKEAAKQLGIDESTLTRKRRRGKNLQLVASMRK